MEAAPSTAAWIALAALWVLLFAGAWSTELRHRREGRQGLHATNSSLPESMQRTLRTTLLSLYVLALAPACIGLISGASWQQIGWWLVAAPPAASVLGEVLVINLAALLHAKHRHVESHERRLRRAAVTVLAIGSLLCVVASVVAGAAGEANLPLVLTIGLSLATVIYQAVWALGRRWSM